MCGIVGILDGRSGRPLEATAVSMSACLRHRGPDADGVWADAERGVALGHRRLSIVELSPLGAQPMRSASGRYTLVFNGEFYNFVALRGELQRLGHAFRGGSDTEVALAAMEQWGVRAAIERLAGMFAIAVWDAAERELVLARDRVGEKPLYYGVVDGQLVAESELKAIASVPNWVPVIDRDVVALYLRGNYVPAPYSIYRGVYKLPPGTLLRVRREHAARGALPEPETYWSLAEVACEGTREPFAGTEAEATTELERLLTQVIREQMIADVPLGALLSGGVDSSTVAALMQTQSARPVRTYTIRFDDPAFDESDYARAVARHIGTEHTEMFVRASDALDLVPRLAQIYDEPFADSSQVPTAIVARLARQHVTVCLTGDGGDETFCGYNRHVALDTLWRRLRHVPGPVRRGAAAVMDAVPTAAYDAVLRRARRRVLGEQVQKLASMLRENDPEAMYVRLASYWEDPASLVLGSARRSTTLDDRAAWPTLPAVLDRLLWVESVTSLPDNMLVKMDRAAMAVALETRTPLVDHRVLEFSWRLPRTLKIRHGRGKWLLRQVLYRHVPPALVDRPKAGFGIPIDTWLRGPLRDWAEALIDERRLREEGFFRPDIVRELWREHQSGRRKWHEQLWGILMFQAWREQWDAPAVRERAA